MVQWKMFFFLHDYIISPESGQLSNHDDGRKCTVDVCYTLVAFVKVFFLRILLW